MKRLLVWPGCLIAVLSWCAFERDGTRPASAGEAPAAELELAWHATLEACPEEIAVDAAGNVYVTGTAYHFESPTSATYGAPLNGEHPNAFLARFRDTGERLWVVDFGGSGFDYGGGVAIDSSGDIWVVGTTSSSDYPTSGSQARGFAGDVDMSICRFRPDGSLAWSSCLGGSELDGGSDIAVGNGGELFVAGTTHSEDFPGLDGSSIAGGFVSKLAPDGEVLWSVYYGGNDGDLIRAIAADSRGGFCIFGRTDSDDLPVSGVYASRYKGWGDTFLARFDSDGNLQWSTYLGGRDFDEADDVAIADRHGTSIFVVGDTYSPDFPSLGDDSAPFKRFCDLFVAQFSGEGDLIWSRLIGGSKFEYASGLALSPQGRLYATGFTRSSDFPVTDDSPQPLAGNVDGFVSSIAPTGSVLWSSVFGETTAMEYLRAAAVTGSSELYVAGWAEVPIPADGRSCGFLYKFALDDPVLHSTPGSFDICTHVGLGDTTRTLAIWTYGPVAYDIVASPSWLIRVSPDSGRSTGSVNCHTVTFVTSPLSPGDYSGQILIGNNVDNSPRIVDVSVRMGRAPIVITVGKGSQYDFTRITDAIDFAEPFDTIVVYPGTYVENIHFGGKNLKLKSSRPDDPDVVAATVIRGDRSGPVVTFDGSETDRCLLSGFTIRNGYASEGGGIHGRGCLATIENNMITRNEASSGGGVFGCNGILQNNEITSNTARRNGGGLAYCGGLIQHNRICNNEIYRQEETVWIDEGPVDFPAVPVYGGGLYGCHGRIFNNLICGNQARSYSSVAVWRYCYGIGYVFVGVFHQTAGQGGGLSDCDAQILGNTIADNSSLRAGNAMYRCTGDIRDCIIWGGDVFPLESCGTPAYSCVQDLRPGGEGNIGDEPLFATGPLGPYYLSQTAAGQGRQSPCVDAGSSPSVELGLASRTTRTDGPGDEGMVDIGYHHRRVTAIGFHCGGGNLNHCVLVGTDAPARTLTVWNTGEQRLGYTISAAPNWLAVSPSNGASSGPAHPNDHRVTYQTASLPLGDYSGAVTIAAPAATNSPVTIPANLKVVATVAVAVMKPVGGRLWHAGTPVDIEWESHGPCDRVLIHLQRSGYNRLLTSTPNREGLNALRLLLPWDLPEAEDFRLRLSWACSPAIVYDESPTFTIVRPMPDIVEPNPTTRWGVETPGKVVWICRNFPAPGEMHVDILDPDPHRLATVPFQNGTNNVDITLPNVLLPGNKHRIRLSWTANLEVFATTPYFTVTPMPTFEITWPAAGTVWRAGTTGDLTFTAEHLPGPSEVVVQLLRRHTRTPPLGQVVCENGTNVRPVFMPPTVETGDEYFIRLLWTESLWLDSVSEVFAIRGESGPTIGVDPTTGTLALQAGPAIRTETLRVRNASPPWPMYYTIATSPSWLGCTPTTGRSTGDFIDHTVTVDPLGLSAGDHFGTLTITAPLADNSPVVVPVEITVTPAPTAVRPKSWRLYR